MTWLQLAAIGIAVIVGAALLAICLCSVMLSSKISQEERDRENAAGVERPPAEA